MLCLLCPKIDVNGEPVLQHVNLLNHKTTADDEKVGQLTGHIRPRLW